MLTEAGKDVPIQRTKSPNGGYTVNVDCRGSIFGENPLGTAKVTEFVIVGDGNVPTDHRTPPASGPVRYTQSRDDEKRSGQLQVPLAEKASSRQTFKSAWPLGNRRPIALPRRFRDAAADRRPGFIVLNSARGKVRDEKGRAGDDRKYASRHADTERKQMPGINHRK
jgi:hypothetical protein